MKININKKVKRIAPPMMGEVCLLSPKTRPTEIYMVFLVPGAHKQFLFICNGNAYLPPEEWDGHVNEVYDHIGTFKQSDMEITINA